jgi:1-acyl-sn-glycerol-3-phosphate acyltransferase
MKVVYKPGARWLTFCLKKIVKIDYEIRNLGYLNEMIQKTNVIIGCDHQSTWETFIFPLILENFVPVVKKELLDVPIAGLYIRKLECIIVDRSSPILAIRSLLKFGKRTIENGSNILIFPNGTRKSHTDLNTEYKSGIFALYKSLNIPVIPARVSSGKFWARRSFRKNPGTIILEFEKPISTGLDKESFFEEIESKLNQISSQ